MTDSILAGYLLTWTTYGAWLHGDERGAYDRKGDTFDAHYVAPNPRFENWRREQLKHAPVLLSAAMRKVVRLAIEECCVFRGWPLLALNVRTNHVHVVVPTCSDPDRIMHDLKARATRRLREADLVRRDQNVWTSGGSNTRLYEGGGIARARDYVINRQGPPLPEE